MGQVQENLKHHFTALLDDLIVQDDIMEMKSDIERIVDSLESSVVALREEFAKSLGTLTVTVTAELASLRSDLNNIPATTVVEDSSRSVSIAELDAKIEEKANLFNTGFGLLAEKVAESFQKQRSENGAMIKLLAERVAQDEQRILGFEAEQRRLALLIEDLSNKQLVSIQEKFDEAALVDDAFENFEEFASKSTIAFTQTVETISDEILLDTANTQEFEIDLSGLEFTTSGHNSSDDIYIDASGQHLYKP